MRSRHQRKRRGSRRGRRSRGEAGREEVAKPDSSGTVAYEKLESFVQPSEISSDVRMMVGKSRRGARRNTVAIQKARGGIETSLQPAFIGGGACPEIDSEQWAIDYGHKRPWPAIHKSIDIPQPHGTPILAVSDGTAVGKFMNSGNRKGIEVLLRHTPAQTGLPFWTYS